MSHCASMVFVALLLVTLIFYVGCVCLSHSHSSISTDMLQHAQQEDEYQFLICIATDGAHVESYYGKL
jgi:hypothetical protein